MYLCVLTVFAIFFYGFYAPALRRCADRVFCSLHRLPEQHACTFDHKAHGRAEARARMVAPRKNVGTALKRFDHADS